MTSQESTRDKGEGFDEELKRSLRDEDIAPERADDHHVTGLSGPPGERPLVWHTHDIGHSDSFAVVAACP